MMVRSLHAEAPHPQMAELPEGLDWPGLLCAPRVEILGGRARASRCSCGRRAVACERD